MNVEKLVDTYVQGLETYKRLGDRQAKLKELITKAVDDEGDADEKGHRWLAAGDYVLQRQKRQGKKYLDKQAALDWVASKEIEDQVMVQVPTLDEDALAGWVFEHRGEDGIEDEYAALWVTPDPTYAFIEPQKTASYDY
jgi:hypothetical protein